MNRFSALQTTFESALFSRNIAKVTQTKQNLWSSHGLMKNGFFFCMNVKVPKTYN